MRRETGPVYLDAAKGTKEAIDRCRKETGQWPKVRDSMNCSTTQWRERHHGNLDARPDLLPLTEDGDAGSRGKARLRGGLEPPCRLEPQRRWTPRRDRRLRRGYGL